MNQTAWTQQRLLVIWYLLHCKNWAGQEWSLLSDLALLHYFFNPCPHYLFLRILHHFHRNGLHCNLQQKEGCIFESPDIKNRLLKWANHLSAMCLGWGTHDEKMKKRREVSNSPHRLVMRIGEDMPVKSSPSKYLVNVSMSSIASWLLMSL